MLGKTTVSRSGVGSTHHQKHSVSGSKRLVKSKISNRKMPSRDHPSTNSMSDLLRSTKSSAYPIPSIAPLAGSERLIFLTAQSIFIARAGHAESLLRKHWPTKILKHLFIASPVALRDGSSLEEFARSITTDQQKASSPKRR